MFLNKCMMNPKKYVHLNIFSTAYFMKVNTNTFLIRSCKIRHKATLISLEGTRISSMKFLKLPFEC